MYCVAKTYFLSLLSASYIFNTKAASSSPEDAASSSGGGGGGISRDLGIADDVSYHSFKKTKMSSSSIIDEYSSNNNTTRNKPNNNYHQYVARDRNGPIKTNSRHYNHNGDDEYDYEYDNDDELVISDEKKIDDNDESLSLSYYSYEERSRSTYEHYLETTTTKNSSEQQQQHLTQLRLHLDKYSHDAFSNVTDLLTNNAVIQKLELHRRSSSTSSLQPMMMTYHHSTTSSSPYTTNSNKRKSNSRKNKIKKIIMGSNGSGGFTVPPSVYDHHSLEDLEQYHEREQRYHHRTVDEIRLLCSIVRDLPRLQELHLWNFNCGIISNNNNNNNHNNKGINNTTRKNHSTTTSSHNNNMVEIPIDEYEIQQEMYALCDLLYEHPTIRKVKLNVSCGKIPDDLLKALGTIPNLITVELQLHESCGLANLIRKSRSTLQELIVHTTTTTTTCDPKHNISSDDDDRNKDVGININQQQRSDPFEYSSEHSLSMMQALENNTTLRYLDLGHNAYLSSFGVRVMGYALRENKTLKTLKYSFNSDSVSSVQQRIEIASKTLKELCQVLDLYGVELHTFVNHTSHNVLVTNDTITTMVQALSKNNSIEEFAFFDETPDVTARKNMAIKRRIRDDVSMSSTGPLFGRMTCM